MPWILQEDGTATFASLRNLDWQAHVYGEAAQNPTGLREVRLSPERFVWSAAASRAGFARNAFPSGRTAILIGCRSDIVAALQDYQARFTSLASAQPAGGYY